MTIVAHFYTRGLLSTYEKRDNPPLAGRPVVVVQNNTVVDFSSEAKKHHIHAGMPKKHAAYNLPGGAFIKYRSDDYNELVTELHTIFSAFSPRLEFLNRQEFFLDLTGERKQASILTEISELLVPAYCDRLIISLATTKLTARACSLALAASTRHYRNLLVDVEIPKTGVLKASLDCPEATFWGLLPVHLLWPLEPKVIGQLQALGLNNCKQVQETSPLDLSRHFGQLGALIHRYSLGLDHSRVTQTPTVRRLVKHCRFPATELAVIEPILKNSANELASRLVYSMEGFREIKLTCVSDTNKVETLSKQFNRVQFTASSIYNNLKNMMEQFGFKNALQSMVISLEGLSPVTTEQTQLFASADIRRSGVHEKLALVISNLNRKYPSKLVHFGSSLPVSRREQMLQLWDPYRFNNQNEVQQVGKTSQQAN